MEDRLDVLSREISEIDMSYGRLTVVQNCLRLIHEELEYLRTELNTLRNK